MMSENERDELALDVLWGKKFPKGATQFTHIDANAAHAIAKAVREAGYRKSRTITTAEELDALPVGSVVLSESYTHYANAMPISFQRWEGGDWHRSARAGSTHPDNFLPATVLFEASL